MLTYSETKNWDPETSPPRMRDYGTRHLQLYKQLRNESGSDILWRIKPKHHMYMEIIEMCSPDNPQDTRSS